MDALENVEEQLVEEVGLLVGEFLEHAVLEFVSLQLQVLLRAHHNDQKHQVNDHASYFNWRHNELAAKVLFKQVVELSIRSQEETRYVCHVLVEY